MASIQSKIGKNGAKLFYVVTYFNGRHKWHKAGSLSDAKIIKKHIEALEKTGRLEKLGITSKQTRIVQFVKEYGEHIRLRTAPSTVKRYLAVLHTFLTFLEMYYPRVVHLSELTSDLIESYQKHRLESIDLKARADGRKPGVHTGKRLPKPQTVNNEVVMLACAFNWGVKRGVINTSPTKNVSRIRETSSRKARLLTLEECNLLIRTAKTVCKKSSLRVYASAMSFLLNTGLRSGELCFLTWDDVELTTGLIKIQPKDQWTPKTYSREFYLNKTALKIILDTRQISKWVFTNSNGNQLETDDVRRVLIKIAKTAGIDGLTRVHDLRHTFCSHLQMNGVDAATVAAIVGHRDLSTTRIYTHQTAGHLKDAINKISVQ